uniref:hypothetical protein n=1 Tax=Streptococcus salivarius TaxID=1304 RepID=UPI003982AAC8
MRHQFQRKVLRKKHRFSQGKLSLKELQQRVQWLEVQWQLIQPKRKKRQLQLWKAK